MLLKQKSDVIGSLSSFICLIHCVFTPFLFAVQSHSSCCPTNTPLWWKSIDYIFLVISFMAVHKSANETSKRWIKHAFYAIWLFLCGIVLNERINYITIPHHLIYIPSLTLIALHFYNYKYCRCTEDTCCSVK